MKNGLQNIGIKSDVILISLFSSLLVLGALFQNVDFELTNFGKLYISQATLDNYDIGKRLNLFWYPLILLPVLFLLFVKIISQLKKRLIWDSNAQKTIETISVIGSVSVVSAFFTIGTFTFSNFILGVLLIYLVLELLKLKFIQSVFVEMLIVSFIVSLGVLFLAGFEPNIISNTHWVCLISFVTVIGGFYLLKQTLKKTYRNIFNLLFPLAFIPVLSFLVIELCFWNLKYEGQSIAYKKIFVLMIVSGFLLVFIVKKLFKVKNLSSGLLFRQFFIPSAIFGVVLLVVYQPLIQQPHDMFELANPANAQMRIFQFGEFPFLDFMPSHMFSEVFYGVIYHLFHGFENSIAFISYRFIYDFIFLLIIYWSFDRWFSDYRLSFIILITAPFIKHFFGYHLFFSIVIFFLIEKMLERKRPVDYLLFSFGLLGMLVWRLDVGVASIFTSILYLGFKYFTRELNLNVKAIKKSVLYFLIICLFGFSVLLLKYSLDYLLKNLKIAYHYVSGNQAHGLVEISSFYDHNFYFLYLIIPFTAVLIILYTLLYIRNNQVDQKTKLLLNSSIFLLMLFLANFQRGLVRHGLIEYTDNFIFSTFFIGVTLFIISILFKGRVRRFQALLVLGFVLLVALKYFPVSTEGSLGSRAIVKSSLTGLDSFFTEKKNSRIVSGDSFIKDNYLDFKQFLDANLTEGQTFLDFSNNPMLYYYTGRKVPSYFCQNLQNTIDDFLQLEQIKRVDTALIPVVVYSNYPNSWWDNTDGVPNIMRQGLLVDFIFSNYKPIGVLSNKSIWVKNSFNIDQVKSVKDTLLDCPKDLNYKKAGFIIANHYQSSLNADFELLSKQIISDTTFLIPNNVSGQSGIWIKFDFDEIGVEKDVRVEFISKDKSIGSVRFNVLKNKGQYMVMVSNQYLWHCYNADQILIHNIEGLKLKTISWYRDLRIE